MNLETVHLRRCDMIRLGGRLDGSTAPDFEKALRDSMDSGVFHIVLEMADVEYFGSAAIRALMMAYKECRRWNRGDVRLTQVPAKVRHVLELAGIWPLITTFEDSVEAVGSY